MVSILIPTRARPGQVAKLIQSALDCFADSHQIEFLLRADDCDKELSDLKSEIKLWQEQGNVSLLTGPRLGGWWANNEMFTQLMRLAKHDWIWLLNDDAVFCGKNVNLSNYLGNYSKILCGEGFTSNTSTYMKAADYPFPLINRKLIESYEFRMIYGPADAWIHDTFHKVLGHEIVFINGLIIDHQRKTCQELANERKLQ